MQLEKLWANSGVPIPESFSLDLLPPTRKMGGRICNFHFIDTEMMVLIIKWPSCKALGKGRESRKLPWVKFIQCQIIWPPKAMMGWNFLE